MRNKKNNKLGIHIFLPRLEAMHRLQNAKKMNNPNASFLIMHMQISVVGKSLVGNNSGQPHLLLGALVAILRTVLGELRVE